MASKTAEVIQGHFQPVKMGLGEAIQRLIHVEFQYRNGAGGVPEQLLSERQMLLDALNVIDVEIGFDCNADGIADTVEIFEQAASTSCCRLMPPGVKPKKKRASRRKTSSRLKK
jgi:hypothetical protein